MRIYLHIGQNQAASERLQSVLHDKRDQLLSRGILFPRGLGPQNHTRLFMAMTDPDHIDTLRYNRGFISAEKQQALRTSLKDALAGDIKKHQPKVVILSAHQLGTQLLRRSELERLKTFLNQFCDDIRVVAHVEAQARALTAYYAEQVLDGRAASLSREVDMVQEDHWWQAAEDSMPALDPKCGQFLETQGAPFWLDYEELQRRWERVFGTQSVTFRPYDPTRFWGEETTQEIRETFDIKHKIGRTHATEPPTPPSAAWLARGRKFNVLLLKLLAPGKIILPRRLWRQMFQELSIEGPPLDPSDFGAITARFAAQNAALCAAHPALSPELFALPQADREWQEADTQMGFRASQYLLAFLHRIEKVSQEEQENRAADLQNLPSEQNTTAPTERPKPSEAALRVMPPIAVKNFDMLQTSSFKPHNNIGQVDEVADMAPYPALPLRTLAKGKSGNVIVGCMKNEAPYILEWVAYHRMIGVDNFLIYTNDCSDGTAEILDRLQELGILQHRSNNDWKGNSPQQYALNQSLKEPVVRKADWIIHIDVDEFINVRCGDGTLADFFERVPEATSVAMTWRLFGHNGVTRLKDEPVIAQFDHCAPKHCPKPHTVWGFKTMFRNNGAYQKFSCHRPNKLKENKRDTVKWVNGSGQDMTREAIDNGWRSSRSSIGYDLLQLNHYALRSAESFLVKRQRGRALHVDRSIGLNYWIRMDWNDHRDLTIQRNVPRLKAELTRLLEDDALRHWHETGLAWHKAKAEELHGMDEFESLYTQAIEMKLDATERVAYALALDLES